MLLLRSLRWKGEALAICTIFGNGGLKRDLNTNLIESVYKILFGIFENRIEKFLKLDV